MPLKNKVDDVATIPEALRSFYEEGADKKFYLQVDGLVPSTKLDEFRDNNIKLLKDLEKFKDIDPAEYAKLKNRSDDDFKKAVTAATTQLATEQIDTAVSTRTKKMAEEHAAALQGLTTKLSSSEQLLSVAMIDNAVRAAAATSGAHETALDDIVLRARTTFKLDDMKVIAFDQKGAKIYDKDGQSPLSVESWLKDLKKTAYHLFKGMEGGGAGGSGNRGNGAVDLSKMTPSQKISYGLGQANISQ